MSEERKINILCATDDNYAAYCGVMLFSVFSNHAKGTVSVFILVDRDLSKNMITGFHKLANIFQNEISFIKVDSTKLAGLSIKGNTYWTLVTYYRILAAELLPSYIERVLYLDCDIIVNGKLTSLWEINLENASVAVVADICTEFDNNYQRLKYDKSSGYFNAGVILMNLKFWRDNDLCTQCLNYLHEYFDRILWNDQDVLNVVMKDSKIFLPATFNFQINFLNPHYFNSFSTDLQNDILSVSNPLIVHYALDTKPWMIKYYILPFNKLWHEYKRRSPWRCIPDELPNRKMVNYIIKRYFLWPLGYMKSSEYKVI